MTAAATAASATTGLSGPPASAAVPEVLAVDFADRTGAFRGGASGTLYGLGDKGAPTQALINGARITNVSQKAPHGTQHPSGDAIKVEDGFFAGHGQDMYLYVQDYYPDWPYHGGRRPGDTRAYEPDGTYVERANGVWDYLEVVELVAEAVATDSSRPQDYVFLPFNEPDGGNWYSDWASRRERFLADWQAVHERIQEVWERHGLGRARIAGPGDTRWQPERSADFLAFAKANGSLPDVFVWHELGIDNLAHYRRHFAEYRELEASLGIDPIPVNITEYGMLRDMGVPGQLVQWFALFEDTKVDAQTAYWNYAGNLSDNSARPNGANAGWWMFKWYGDLAGSETVRVRPPAPDTADTLQGIAAVDGEQCRAHVVWGGTDGDVALDLSGLDPAVFGGRVDVEVREITLTGAEGLAGTPRLILARDGAELRDGALRIAVPTYDRYAGYQLVITPEQSREVEAAAASQAWTASIEAEDMALTEARVRIQDPQADGGWKFPASGGRDVGSFDRAGSKAEWTVAVPHGGAYRLQVIGAAPGVPGRHALFIDDAPAGTIQYTAGLARNETSRWQYRGSAETLVDLTEGAHTLSIRAGIDGSTTLPNSDITLDKVSLTSLDEGEPTVYPASTFRLVDGARLDWERSSARGGAALGDEGRAELYVTAMETGYHDLVVHWESDAAASLDLTVNGTPSAALSVEERGRWRSTARVHLAEGINEIVVRPLGKSDGGSRIESLTTVRARAADAAAVAIEAEEAIVHGEASVVALADETGTNASGLAYVGWIGGGEANAIEIPREGFAVPGDYDVTVHYANAELSGEHDYNPQVVDRRLEVREGAMPVGEAHFRYTYSWDSFWQRTIPVKLSTTDEPLRLGNAEAWAPDIDRVVIAPRLLGEPATEPLAPSGTAS